MNASLSVAKKINNNADIIYVFLADGNYKSVKIDSQTTVKVFINLLKLLNKFFNFLFYYYILFHILFLSKK